MKKETIVPTEREYPYLAIFRPDQSRPSNTYFEREALHDIFVVSLDGRAGSDVRVTRLDGSESWVTEKEGDFVPFPSGSIIKLIQS